MTADLSLLRELSIVARVEAAHDVVETVAKALYLEGGLHAWQVRQALQSAALVWIRRERQVPARLRDELTKEGTPHRGNGKGSDVQHTTASLALAKGDGNE